MAENIAPERVGILLDVGCGEKKHGPNWVGIDIEPYLAVDLVHDLEVFPWPIESDSVITAKVSHIFEHIKPWLTIKFMNELWRVMKVGGEAWFACPYGVTPRYVQDPTHCNPVNERTFWYFDPQPYDMPPDIKNNFFGIYPTKPWKIKKIYWNELTDLEVVLEKRPENQP